MEVRKLQAALNALGLKPTLTVDGSAGKKTMAAIEGLLKGEAKDFANWSDARLLIAAEQLVYKRAGIEVGLIDGLVGEQTRYARTVYEARLRGDKKVETWRDTDTPPPAGHNATPSSAIIPASHWPKQNAGAMDAFFGAKGTNQKSLVMPFPLRIAWEPAKTVMKFDCNAKVHGAMTRIWQRTHEHYGHEEIKRLRLDMYGGCLNVRKMRGGSAWSIHSWGCAYDVDPDRNQLKFTRKSASLDDAPFKKFWEFVYEVGAISLGIERDYDWMHFQFARL